MRVVQSVPSMRTWNELISRNAKLAIHAAQLKHREATGKKLSDRAIAGRMSRTMTGRTDPDDASIEACRKGYQRPLKKPKKHFWRADYLAAFGRAVGVPPEVLGSTDYTPGTAADADYGQWFFQEIGDGLTPEQSRGLASRIQRVGEVPGMHDLTGEIIEACLAADTQVEASVAVLGVIQSKDIWAKRAAKAKRSRQKIRST